MKHTEKEKRLAKTCRLLIKYGNGRGHADVKCVNCPGDHLRHNPYHRDYLVCDCGMSGSGIDPRCAEGARSWLKEMGFRV